MKKCTSCSEEKELTEFHRNNRINGYHSRCKKCYRTYDQRYYAGNKESVKRRTAMKRLELREWYWKKKAGSCSDCYQLFHPVCMQFDHRPSTIKIASVSDLVAKLTSKEEIEVEIQKCDLVCANCHALRTWDRLQEIELN